MKNPAFVLLSMLVLASGAIAEDDASSRLAEFEKEFEKRYAEEIKDPYGKDRGRLNAQFLKALEREEQKATQSGQLEKVLAFKSEILRIEGGEDAGAIDDPKAPPALQQLRQTWHQRNTLLETQRNARAQTLLSTWDEALENYQATLVKQQDISGAQAVKAFRDNIAEKFDAFGVSVSVTVPETEEPGASPSPFAPGPLHGIPAEGRPAIGAADGIDDFVSVVLQHERWAAIREGGQVLSSIPFLDGKRNVKKVVIGDSPTNVFLIDEQGNVEYEGVHVPPGIRKVRDIYNSRIGHGGAVTEDGEIVVWGDLYQKTSEFTKPPQGITNAVSIAATYFGPGFRAVALLEDGSIISWGEKAKSIEIPGQTRFKAISPYNHGILALTTNGRAFDCGLRGTKEFGEGQGPFIAIRCNQSPFFAAQREDGTWYAESITGQNGGAITARINSLGPTIDLDVGRWMMLWIGPESK